jgi:hypothetical protein
MQLWPHEREFRRFDGFLSRRTSRSVQSTIGKVRAEPAVRKAGKNRDNYGASEDRDRLNRRVDSLPLL